jgi:hypothetical protein
MSIGQIRSRYLLMRWSETILFGLAGAAIVGSTLSLFSSLIIAVSASIVAGLIIIFSRYRVIGLSKVNDLRISLYLNRFYPELKDSSDLLVKDSGSLTVLEQIQLTRIDSKINDLDVKLPHKLPQAAMAVIIASGLFLAATNINLAPNSKLQTLNSKQETPEAPLDPSIKSAQIKITPPNYTGLQKTVSTQLTFGAPEGSQVLWTISFHQPVSNTRITFTTGDSIVQKSGQQDLIFKYTLTTSVLYRIQWTANGESHSSDYHRIDVKPDQAPAVSIKDLPQFTRLKWGDRNTIDVASNVSDDYGLTAAHVIATVSKGSGESVKFREEKLAFISPSKITGKSLTGKLTLDFRKLGMDPGDEVYFYVEAFDNKQPQHQRNRTDTYFIALQDTTQQEMVMDEGLGVDVMPDYFRSQRQLIIDTEKLLADQKAKKVTKQQFNSTSNELGYDQKVLRLRYGQFLGEEFETSIGQGEAHEDHDDGEKKEGEDIIKEYGHQHDTGNEHNLVADEKKKEDPLAAFKHNHDSEEEATFFTQSIKAKLRAALTLMWDSELKLRMYQPKESLPTQYQILKLLKEISQDSRVYVHRMGFDPPPLKEDKRLTGSLEEVKPGSIENNLTGNLKYPAIRAALTDLSTLLLDKSITLNDQQRADLNAAGNELATLALGLPGNYLKVLSDLKMIEENKLPSNEVRGKLEDIQRAFWTVLPNEAPSPTQTESNAHFLDLKLLKEIND